MAEREAKARKRAVKAVTSVRPAPAPAAATKPVVAPVHVAQAKPADVRALEAERDRLLAELEVARDRIAELERTRDQVLNRIDWVIDSLHSLADE